MLRYLAEEKGWANLVFNKKTIFVWVKGSLHVKSVSTKFDESAFHVLNHCLDEKSSKMYYLRNRILPLDEYTLTCKISRHNWKNQDAR